MYLNNSFKIQAAIQKHRILFTMYRFIQKGYELMKKISVIILALIIFNSCNAKKHVNPDYLAYIHEYGMNPTSYLVKKLDNYKIVILGEMHEQKDTLLFIKDSLSVLYNESDLEYFATEFIRNRNQEQINKIVNSENFDRDAVIDIYRDFAWVWGYKEYIDIIEEIWRINRNADINKRIKIIALDYEWKDWSGAQNESTLNRDEYMTQMFIDNYNNKGKAIIHTGFNHSFLHYNLNNMNRMGNLLYSEYGDHIFQVCLHHQMMRRDDFDNKKTYIPYYMDDLFVKNDRKSFGIDITDSPFRKLQDENTYFFQDDATVFLEDITEGYIVINKLNKIQHSEWIDGFINDVNFEKAKEIAKNREWFVFDDDISVNEINKKYKEFMTF